MPTSSGIDAMEEIDLPISLVFLDTCIYIASNFNFGGNLFSALKQRVLDKQVEIGITVITKREVEAKICKYVDDAKNAIEKAISSAKILKNSITPAVTSLYSSWKSEEVADEIVSKFHDYLRAFDVSVLDCDGVNVDKIFDLYFAQRPPFGQGNKKTEFPDAFASSAVEEWGLSEGKKVYVVSGDQDMREGVRSFNQLIRSDSLAALLDTLSNKYEKIVPDCMSVYAEVRSEIDEKLKDAFSDKWFFVGDQDGEVNSIDEIELGEYTPNLLRVEQSDNGGYVTCEFEVVATISFVADITYGDFETASYDSEDKVYIFHNMINKKVREDVPVMAKVVIKFDNEDPSDIDVEQVVLDAPETVSVYGDRDYD